MKTYKKIATLEKYIDESQKLAKTESRELFSLNGEKAEFDINAMEVYEKLVKNDVWKDLIRNAECKTCPYCDMQKIRLGQSGDEVEHIKPKSGFPSLSVSYNNLICVCPNCNKKKSGRDPVFNHVTIDVDEIEVEFNVDFLEKKIEIGSSDSLMKKHIKYFNLNTRYNSNFDAIKDGVEIFEDLFSKANTHEKKMAVIEKAKNQPYSRLLTYYLKSKN